jgi:hypothetical protein
MTRGSWVQREAESLIREYERLGVLSPKQCETLVDLVEDGQHELALHLLDGFKTTLRHESLLF